MRLRSDSPSQAESFILYFQFFYCILLAVIFCLFPNSSLFFPMIYDTITSYTRRTPAEFPDARRQGGVQLDTKKVVDDLTDVGADILGAVTEAINSNDYSNLSRTINESLGSVVRNYTNGSVNEKGYGDVRRGTGAYTPYRQAARGKDSRRLSPPLCRKGSAG